MTTHVVLRFDTLFQLDKKMAESQILQGSLFPAPTFVHSRIDVVSVIEFMVTFRRNRFS